MYAIIATGGKQYRASVGDMLDVEKIDGDVGDEVTLTDVLLVADDEGNVDVGRPQVGNATVVGRIVAQDRNKKVVVFKSKRRKHYSRKRGHRQDFTRIKIEAIHR